MRKLLLFLTAPLAFAGTLTIVACGGDDDDDNDGKAKAGRGGSSAQQGSSGSGQQGSPNQQGPSGSGGSGTAGVGGGGGESGAGGGALPLGPTFASLKENIFLTRGCNNCHDRMYEAYDELIVAQSSEGPKDGSAEESCTANPKYKGKTIIVKGDAEASLLYIKVSRPTSEQDCGVRMPQTDVGPEKPLSQEEIDAIKGWIDNGAKND